jgi:hypothetical protein
VSRCEHNRPNANSAHLKNTEIPVCDRPENTRDN